jgi:Tol biopolymer transport system component
VQDSGNNELLRVDLKTQNAETLCWPDTVYGGGQANHVHPSISARGNYADFSSARSGSPDLYVFPLNG